MRAGVCDDCGHHWTIAGGGINADGQCQECARRIPARHLDRVYREVNDYEMPHELDDELADAGAGLGV